MTYPKHVFKSPGPYEWKRRTYAVATINSDEELSQMLASGWHETRSDAFNPPANVEVPEVVEIGAPTRAELEQKARELNIKFDGRTTDKRLGILIAQALELP
jgi:hypothetical protein